MKAAWCLGSRHWIILLGAGGFLDDSFLLGQVNLYFRNAGTNRYSRPEPVFLSGFENQDREHHSSLKVITFRCGRESEIRSSAQLKRQKRVYKGIDASPPLDVFIVLDTI